MTVTHSLVLDSDGVLVECRRDMHVLGRLPSVRSGKSILRALFQEVRIADYLASYRATGRPPQPAPAYPTDAALRSSQGLPPLFVPAPFPNSTSTPSTSASTSGAPSIFGISSAPSTSSAATIKDPTQLPQTQAFNEMLPVNTQTSSSSLATEKELFTSIVATPTYLFFSPEELRYYSYARRIREPPPGTPMFPFTVVPLASSGSHSAAGGVLDGTDKLVSIVAQPDFAKHSPEELRIAFLKAGTELNSAQILSGSIPSKPAASNVSPFAPSQPAASPFAPRPAGSSFAPPPPIASTTGSSIFSGSAFGSPPVPIQPNVFGQASAPAPATGGFSFGQPAAAVPPPVIATTGFSFGSSAPVPPNPTPAAGGFSFGQPAQPVTAAPTTFSFGSSAPAAPAPSAFGAPAAAPAASGFSFGQPPAQQQQQQQQQPAGFSFGTPAPAQQATGFSFGATAAPAGGGFSFGTRRM
ncbi:unnamed protein product [Mycena citricolor]|uniref:Uncharacterized protein n=1 Tax=Mycena citricolor TaxID=2018698 RepID=A0AAD2Q1M2_9AGAR|nr:unnamed protein product [Mycena citricolor]